MTKHLVIMGGSLMDSGNTASLLSLVGQNPFSDDIYDGGDNIKASDGPVLGEHIALQLGANLDDAQLFSLLDFGEAKTVDVHNFAHAGARSDQSPQLTIPFLGYSVGIGLKEQLKLLKRRKSFYRRKDDVDVLLSCSGNDVRDAFDRKDDIARVIETSSRRDEKKLAKSIAKPISKNIRKTVDQITGFTDEIALIGSLPVAETPEAIRWASSFPEDQQSKALSFLDLVGRTLQQRLESYFQADASISVVDGRYLWDQLDQPVFVDSVHPTSDVSRELAVLFVDEVSESLTSFGF